MINKAEFELSKNDLQNDVLFLKTIVACMEAIYGFDTDEIIELIKK